MGNDRNQAILDLFPNSVVEIFFKRQSKLNFDGLVDNRIKSLCEK